MSKFLKLNKLPSPSVLQRIGQILNKIFRYQKRLNLKLENQQFSKSPSQSIELTLQSLQFSSIEEDIYILAFYYLDKFTAQQNIFITKQNSTILLITSILLASKIQLDEPRSNRYFSCISGISQNEIVECEREIIIALDYKLIVSEIDFENYCNQFWDQKL